MLSQAKGPRRSVFRELDVDLIVPRKELTARTSAFYSGECCTTTSQSQHITKPPSPVSHSSEHSIKASRSAMFLSLYFPSRLLATACALLVTLSILYDTPFLSAGGPTSFGAVAGIIRSRKAEEGSLHGRRLLAPRADTNTAVCNRWSQQSALVNGTLYLYGGHATTEQGQQNDTWVNDFLTIDVTKTWDISSPAFKGLPQPSGPPPVSNGYLWHSYDALYLYGGEFSDSPPKTPSELSLWSYDIKAASWTEHKNPRTSAGKNSESGDQPLQRAAEGAGISVPELGRGYYFAGHLDTFTTPGWSYLIDRLYLKSLVEYTFPGHSNDAVESLGDSKTAGQDGVWRNITEGGIQDTAQFPIRADSATVYVPGYGAKGILVNLGGGTNVSFVS